VLDRLPTAPIAATGLIAGYGVAVTTGSRALGGVVLALCGLICVAVWARRDGRRTTIWLSVGGLAGFALSHVIALAIGAWPAVLVVAAIASAAYWRFSDSKRVQPGPVPTPRAAGQGAVPSRAPRG
jgi:branched-subunit amino acid permease